MINEMAALIGRVAIYSLMFIVSLYFVNQADKTKSRGKFIFLSLLALIIPCLFAAFRGEKVGTDVLQYAKPYYLGALNSSNLQAFLLQGSAEKGYERVLQTILCLQHCCTFTSRRIHWFNDNWKFKILLFFQCIFC